MKALLPQIFLNRFSLLILAFAVSASSAWFLWQIFLNDVSSMPAGQFLVGTSVIFAVFVLVLALALVKIRALIRSHRDLLQKDAIQKQTAETLRESEARYRIVTESASDAILTIDREHTILFANAAAEKTFGYTVDELIGNKLFMLMPERLRGAHAAGMKRYGETGKRNIPWQGVELPALHKDGYEIPIEVTFGELTNDGKHIFTAVIRDITERKKTEEILQSSEARYRMLFDSNPNPVLVFDLKTLEILAVNHEALNLYGFSTEEFLTMSIKDIRPPEGIPAMLEQVAVSAAAQGKLTCSTRHRKKDGTVFEAEITGHPISFKGREARIVLITDFTDRHEAEHALLQSDQRYRNILETIEEGYYELDLAGNFTFVNEAMVMSFRYSKDELVGLNYRRYVDEATAANLFQTYNRVFTTGEPVSNLGFEIIRKDGTNMFSETSIALMRDAGGEPTGFRGIVRDITLRRKTEEALRESESILAAAQRITHLGSWELDLADLADLNNNAVRWSDETYRIFGYEPGQVEVSNDLFYNSAHPDDRRRIAEVLRDAVKQRKPYNIEHRIVLADKSERTLYGQAELVYDQNTSKPLKMLGTVQDITERRRTDIALRDSEYKLRTLFTSMNEGLTQVDNNEVIEFVNDQLCAITGYERDEMIGKVTLDLLFDDEGRRLVAKANVQRKQGISGQYEARLRQKSGEMLWVLISGAPIINTEGELTGTLGMFMDISERKHIEQQLLHDAFHDGLTGLANRALFMDHLRLTIERYKSRHSNHYAVLFLDVDRFKVINDSLGHSEGDELLKEVARRLAAMTRTGDLLARLGGDEFVILLTEMIEINDAINVAERIQDDLRRPFKLGGNEVFVSASIGIAPSIGEHGTADEMLRDADIAMYRAKTKGKAQYQVFNKTMRAKATTRLQMETEMRQAIERREFELHYQPIIDLETRELHSFEALVRWRHPTRGMIPPNDFVPTAEETGLILPLGRWILEESCRQMSEWQDVYPQARSLIVSVNLSCKQFLQSALADQVEEVLNATGLPSHCLKLEITESHLMENSEKAVKIMNRLCRLGVELSLDDFGTGYSSLSYLHRLPITTLKIDRSFISRMTDGSEYIEIVRTIIKLAKNLKMNVVAEGIETAEQLDQLNRLKCGYGQGYLFSKPLEAETAAAFINENLRNLSGPTKGPVINLEMDM